MTSRLTIKDINDLSSVGISLNGSVDFKKQFYQMSMRPTILSNASQKKSLEVLINQIHGHKQELKLLKEKLKFKSEIESRNHVLR